MRATGSPAPRGARCLAAPVVLALVPLLLGGRAWLVGSVVCAALLEAGVALGALSLGVFFVPALVASLVALVLPPLRPRGG